MRLFDKMSRNYILRVSVVFVCVGVRAMTSAQPCSSSGYLDFNTVSAYGGDQVTLVLAGSNSCGLSPASTVTVTYAGGEISPSSDVEVIDSTKVTFITPQFQSLGRTQYTMKNGAKTFSGSIIVVETLRKPLSIEYSSGGNDDDVTVKWDRNEFDSGETVTLYIHDLGDGLTNTAWTNSIVVADDIPAAGGSHTFKASVVYGKRYSSGCFYIKRKRTQRNCRACKQRRYYCPIRRFHERFWKEENYRCDRWNSESPEPAEDTPRCPPTEDQARFDSRFVYIDYDISYYHRGSQHCYVPVSPGHSNGGQVCCYFNDGRSNCGSGSGGGYYFYRHPKRHYWSHYKHDIMGWFACCYVGFSVSTSSGGGAAASKWALLTNTRPGATQPISSWLANVIYDTNPTAATSRTYYTYDPQKCSLFYKKRVKWCGHDYRPPRRRNRGKGDPHLATFDGFNYTFNGHGDYWMVKHNDPALCSVQARLEPFNAGANGTVITAIAMKCGASDDPIIVKLNNARDAAEVHVGAAMRVDMSPDGVSTISSGDVVATVVKNGSLGASLAYILSGGVDELVFEVSVGAGQLTFVGSADGGNYEGKILGLAGNADGNRTNDLRPRSGGDPLSTTSNLSTIHNSFGETWRVLESGDVLFFPYGVTTPGTNFTWPAYNAVNNPGYVPSFTPGSAGCNAACGNDLDCCFDLRATNNIAFATATKEFDKLYNSAQTALQRAVQVCDMVLFRIISFAVNGLNEIPSFVEGSSYDVSCGEGKTLVGSSKVSCTNGRWSWNDIRNIPVCLPTEVPEKQQTFAKVFLAVFRAVGNGFRIAFGREAAGHEPGMN